MNSTDRANVISIWPSVWGIVMANGQIAIHWAHGSADFEIAWYATMLGIGVGAATVAVEKWRLRKPSYIARLRELKAAPGSLRDGLHVALPFIAAVWFLIYMSWRIGAKSYVFVPIGYWMASWVFLSADHAALGGTGLLGPEAEGSWRGPAVVVLLLVVTACAVALAWLR